VENNKLSVGLVIDSFYPSIDGVIKVVESYIYGLKDKCDLTLITVKPKKSEIEKYYSNLPCKVIFCNGTKFKLQQYYVATPKLDFTFKDKLDNCKFDLLHIHSLFPLGIYMFKYAKSNDIKVITTVHSQLLPDIKRYIKSDIIANGIFKKYITIFNNMDCVYSLNQKMDDYIKEHGFIGKSIIMPNGTHFVAPTQLNTNKPKNTFLFVGRLIEPKGILFILDALNILKQKNIDFNMLYVGGGPDESKLKIRIGELGLADNVKLLGSISDIDKLKHLYLSSTLFLFPSTYDTDGLVKREAASCCLPSVMLKDTFASSEIQDGINGFVSDNTPVSFAQTIIDAINNKQKLKTIGLNAKKSLYIPWDKQFDTIYENYIDVVNAKNNSVVSKH